MTLYSFLGPTVVSPKKEDGGRGVGGGRGQ